MKTAGPSIVSAVKNSVHVRAYPKVTAEWNYNRYADVYYIKNLGQPAGTTEVESKYFPIESIVETQRPKQGIIMGQAAKWSYPPVPSDSGITSPAYGDIPPASRTYTVGEDSLYKYWLTPEPSLTSVAPFGDYEFSATGLVRPAVLYTDSISINKIVIGFEASFVSPTRTRVHVTFDGINWVQVAEDTPVDSEGRIILYLQSNGGWTTTVTRDYSTKVFGIRVDVVAIDAPDSYLGIIELSPRLENDLTDVLISYGSEFTMDEANFITPLGQCSSNTAELTLSNIDGRFNNENIASPYFGIIDKNVLFTLDLVYQNDSTGEVSTIRQFTMYADDWQGETEVETSVALKDASKFLQEQDAPQRLIEKVTVGEAIWRLCDAIGFTDYVYVKHDGSSSAQISYFWTTGEETVWEVFQSLAEATQTAIYFDEYGLLRITTREAAFNRDNSIVWDFDATDDNGKLADIEEASLRRTYEANHVEISYKTTKVSEFNRGLPAMEVVWEPEGSFTLRAAPLHGEEVGLSSQYIRIGTEHAKTWPYEGLVQIEGEIIRYKGKRYRYYVSPTSTAPENYRSVIIYSQEEKEFYDREQSNQFLNYKNDFTGHLVITERGVNGTNKVSHSPNHRGMTVTSTQLSQTNTVSRGVNGYIRGNNEDSTITFGPGTTVRGPSDWHSATVGSTLPAAADHFGTSLKFTEAGYHVSGGMFINGGPNGSGYYIELFTTKLLEERPDQSRIRAEVGMVVRRPDGSWYRPQALYTDKNGDRASADSRGVPYPIAIDVWYDLDVIWYSTGVELFINGASVAYFSIPTPLATNKEFGLWISDAGQIKYDYLYGFKGITEDDPYDENSLFDMIRGGYASKFWDNYQEKMWNWPKTFKRTRNVAVNPHVYYFDEFGAIAHEIKEMEVTFEKAPVLHSRLFVTNETQVFCPEYRATPFGATFVLQNRSRQNAIANGEDAVTFGADNTVQQTTMIYGRTVFQEDAEVVTVRNDNSVRARGKVEIEFDSQWIQSEGEAEALAAWIVDNWSEGCDEVDLVVFGNPFVEITDVVSVNFPEKGMYSNSHRYFVVSVSSQFDQGLTTKLTLRRAKI